MEDISCPFCNFKTPYPSNGRIQECLGECYSTYTLILKRDDLTRTKMRLVEIFFLDGEFNLRIKPDELDARCEFSRLETGRPGEYILFAREHRVVEGDIDALKKLVDEEEKNEGDFWIETMERFHSALDRFERNLKNVDYDKKKLQMELKVVENVINTISEKIQSEIDSELQDTVK